MDSLVFLCARRIIAQHPLPDIAAHLYPVLFQVAFLDGRTLVLRDLVATWPFPELHLQRIVGDLRVRWDHPYIDSVQAVLQGVVEQLEQELEEPSSDSRCQLRMLDVTGFFDDQDNWITKALAEACMKVSKHQQEFQRHRPKQHNGCSGATTTAPQPVGMDVHTDLFVNERSYEILHDALQTGATAPLRIKCHKFEAQCLSASQIVTLSQCLDPSCLRRVKHGQGMLPSLRKLSLEFTDISGNLHQILGNLQTPLESLGLAICALVPDDLAFLSQSIHAPALKRLKLNSYDISQGLLEPLRLLLEKASASLLCLDLTYCCIADSHLAVLLPTLLRCSHLRFLGLFRNPLSRAAIKDLLQKTLKLPDLHVVVYPYPLDCYTGDPSEFRLASRDMLNAELFAAAKVEFSQILANSRRTDLVWSDDPYSKEALAYCFL